MYVRTYQSKSATYYWVTLGWRGTGRQTWFPLGDETLQTRKDVSLSSHKTSADADAQARDLAAKLGIPVEIAGSERYGQDPAQIAKRASVMSAVAGAVGLLILLVFAGLPLLVQFQLDAQGRTVAGSVVRRWSGKASHVKVAYHVNEQIFTNTDDVTSANYERLAPGTRVRVTYLPSYPHTSRTDVSNARRSSAVLLSVYGGFMVAAWVWYGLKNALKKRKRPEVPRYGVNG